MELKDKTIAVLGDSITEGAGASDLAHRFTSVMETQFDCRVLNYGIGGTRIARQQHVDETNPYDQDFCMRVRQMDRHADAVVVFGGTNDFGHGSAPLGDADSRTPDTFYGACHDLMRYLVETYTGKPVLICTPLHRLGEECPKGDGSKPFPVAPLAVYRNILLEVACYYALPVLDLYASSGMQPAVPVIQQRLMPDGLHPSDEGHAILARRIGLALMSL